MVPSKSADPHAVLVLEYRRRPSDLRSDQERALITLKGETAIRVKQKGVNAQTEE